MKIFVKMHNCNYSWTMFFVLLMYSITMSISSNSMIWIWISLELNTMFFIPLLMTFNSVKSSEQIMKFFLIQSISSNLILLMFLSLYLFMKLNFNKFNSFIYLFLTLKMGSAPMMKWLLNLLQNFKWLIFFLMTTLQKIIPFNILIMIFNIKFMLIMSILNSMFGSFMGLNQLSLRKIMLFSSLNHLSWTILSLCLTMKVFKFYFIFYSMMTYFMCYMFNMFKINFINQMFTFNMNLFKNNMNLNKYMFLMIILYFMSMPPILGMFPKFMIMLKSSTKIFILILILIFMNLISLTFYTRLTLMFMLNHFNILKFKIFNYNLYKFNIQNKIFMTMMLNFMVLLFFIQKVI